MNENFTTTIKGYAILLVFCIHTISQLGVKHIQFVAAIGVSLFIICSGYGIQKSYIKNGLNYYWRKKIITIFIPFWIVEIVAAVVLKEPITVLFPKLIFYKCNWYVQYIVICYLIFWIVNIIGNIKALKLDTRKKEMVLLLLFAIWFIVDGLYLYRENAITLRGRQMLAFPFGVVLANNVHLENRLLNLKNNIKHFIFLFGVILVSTIIMYCSEKTAIVNTPVLVQNAISLFTVFPIAICFLCFVSIYKKWLINRLVYLVGLISYEIFLVHCQLYGYLYVKKWIIIKYFVYFIIGTAILYLFDRCILNSIRKRLIEKKNEIVVKN